MVEEQKARVESLKLLKSLDAQIEEKQKMEQADFKQFLAEKRLIDEIIAKVRMSYQLYFILSIKRYTGNKHNRMTISPKILIVTEEFSKNWPFYLLNN